MENILHPELGNKRHASKMNMELTLEGYLVLESNLIHVKEEYKKSQKWKNFSKILTNLFCQGNNNRRGLSCEKIYPPYNCQLT